MQWRSWEEGLGARAPSLPTKASRPRAPTEIHKRLGADLRLPLCRIYYSRIRSYREIVDPTMAVHEILLAMPLQLMLVIRS